MKKQLTIKLALSALLVLFLTSTFALNPRRVFKKKCSKCHTIGKGIKLAPDLVNLENRKEHEWVTKFLLNKDDPKHNFQKYKGKKMDEILAYVYAVGAGSNDDIKSLRGQFKAGRFISSRCVSCHGPAGLSHNPTIPHLRGQNFKYLVTQLKAYKYGKRVDKDGIMSSMAKSLSDRDIVNLATYYSELNNGD